MLENVGFAFCQIAKFNISMSELRIIRIHTKLPEKSGSKLLVLLA